MVQRQSLVKQADKMHSHHFSTPYKAIDFDDLKWPLLEPVEENLN